MSSAEIMGVFLWANFLVMERFALNHFMLAALVVRIMSPGNGPSNLVPSLVSLKISEANFPEILILTSLQQAALIGT